MSFVAIVRKLGLAVTAVLMPVLASAQSGASITGTVKDASGGVLPGVTVEVTSPALIERVRTAVTDGAGQYRIESLRPGTYAVSFSLTGFAAYKREGIELVGSFVASVNADLKVGQVSETITVSGESPLVDVQASKQQRVIEKQELDVIPTGRTVNASAVLIPGIVNSAPDVGGTANLPLTSGQLTIHGGSGNDFRQTIDGIPTGSIGLAFSSGFVVSMTSAQEVAVDYSSGTAEQATPGIYANVIPRDGGNKFTGSFFGTAVNGSFQGTNYTSDLAARGLATPNTIKLDYDFNPGVGGPIVKDRLWFYSSARFVVNSNYVAGLWFNQNAGNPAAWTYAPDLNRPAYSYDNAKTINLRLTLQPTPKNKVTLSADQEGHCFCSNVVPGQSPESAVELSYPVEHFVTAGWTVPITPRLLFEARAGLRREEFVHNYHADPSILQLIDVTEQGGLIPGLHYRGAGLGITSQPFYINNSRNIPVLASLSYVTGQHAFKAGFTENDGRLLESYNDNNSHVSYRFNNGVPNLITERATPYVREMTQPWDFGLYAQDRWTLSRLTLNLGVRYDYFTTVFPAQSVGPGLLVPTRSLSFPETPMNNFKDVVPRLGAAYDLFGTGKTAVKVSLGKYMQALGPTIAPNQTNGVLDPLDQLSLQVTRSWRPTGTAATNPNYYTPNCNLTNPLANGDCGIVSNINFGNQTPTNLSDPRTATGFGNRPYQWEFSTSVQHQLTPTVSVNVGYFRRWAGNFTVVDNLALDPSRFSAFSITAPVDPRLPGGGGYSIGPLFDPNPDSLTVSPINTNELASDYGSQIQHWNGVDVSVNSRLRRGVTIQGGLSTGRTSTDNCQILTKVPEANLFGAPYCHTDQPFLTQLKVLGSYIIPRVDVQISGALQSVAGPAISANQVIPNSAIAPLLGRNLSGGAANVTVNLVQPGTLFGDRLNQLDVRFGKIFKFGQTRTQVSLDLYNALNSNAVLTENTTYVNSGLNGWRIPTSIEIPRFAKFSVQFDF
jgi:hypothetical protein